MGLNDAAFLGASAPLGIVTKKYVTPPSVGLHQGDLLDTSTGEILTRTPQIARAERWALKSVVNRLLSGDRVSKCMVLRAPISGHGLAPIEIHKGCSNGKAFYHGLMACGSVWTCPVCAAKIAERRRLELKQAIEAAKVKGFGVYFVTLTVPHGVGDDLHQLLANLSASLKRLSQDQHFRRIKKRLGIHIEGFIRAQEVTYGQNGWHPHFHMIVFTPDRSLSCSVLQQAYSEGWRSACLKSGLPEPHPEYGCTVQDGTRAAEYVSKWGIEDEMTKSHAKQGKRNGLSPWGLLRAVLDGNTPEIAPEPAAALFRLYAHAFKGRRQLHWSVGLRAKLLPDQVELSDQDLVDRPDDERAALLSEISTAQWKAIRNARAQASILDAAESDPRLISVLIDRIMSVSGGCSEGDAAGAPAEHDRYRYFTGLHPDTPPPTPAPFVNERHALGFCLADIGRIRL